MYLQYEFFATLPSTIPPSTIPPSTGEVCTFPVFRAYFAAIYNIKLILPQQSVHKFHINAHFPGKIVAFALNYGASTEFKGGKYAEKPENVHTFRKKEGKKKKYKRHPVSGTG